MPKISEFYGVLVLMYFLDSDRHNLPHIHVRYGGDKASIAIEDGRTGWKHSTEATETGASLD